MVAEDIIISCLLVSCLVLFCFVRHCTNKDWPIQIILPCFSIAIRSSRMSPCWMSSSWYARTDLYPASKLSSQRVVDGTKSAPFPSPLPTHPHPSFSSTLESQVRTQAKYCFLIIAFWPLGLHTHRAFRLLMRRFCPFNSFVHTENVACGQTRNGTRVIYGLKRGRL